MLTQQLALVVIVGLAGYRLSRFLGVDTLFDNIRHRFFRRFPPDDDYARMYRLDDGKGKGSWQIAASPKRPLSKLGQLVICPWCSSVWFIAAIVAVLAWRENIPDPLLVWAASCSVAGLCGKLAAD